MIEFKEGDVVELVSMPDDPSPIEIGTKGYVKSVNSSIFKNQVQYHIAWANGRTLMAVCPPDELRLVGQGLLIGPHTFILREITDEAIDRYIAARRAKWESMKNGDSIWGMIADCSIQALDKTGPEKARVQVREAHIRGDLNIFDEIGI